MCKVGLHKSGYEKWTFKIKQSFNKSFKNPGQHDMCELHHIHIHLANKSIYYYYYLFIRYLCVFFNILYIYFFSFASYDLLLVPSDRVIPWNVECELQPTCIGWFFLMISLALCWCLVCLERSTTYRLCFYFEEAPSLYRLTSVDRQTVRDYRGLARPRLH